MDYPKISIVTPSFNQGGYIEETILSVLQQEYPNLEYVIIDGGSTDETVEVIQKYESHLKYWVSEKDEGQSDAINKGLAHCTGEIFNWLNSDDKLAPGALLRIAQAYEKDTEIISGREIYFSENHEEERHGSLLYSSLEETIFQGVIYQPSTFWRLSALKEVLPVNQALHYLMDADLWVRHLLRKGTAEVVKLEAPLACFRIHEGAKTSKFAHLFTEERWLLREAFLRDSGIADWLLPYLPAYPSKPAMASYQPLVAYDAMEMTKLYVEALLEYYYIASDYTRARQLLKAAGKQGVSSSRINGYRSRLRLPSWLLNILRRAHA